MSVRIELDSEAFEAGDTLEARLFLDAHAEFASKDAVWSIAWFTEGRGDTDVGIAHEGPLDVARLVSGDPARISAKLPIGPLTYDGKLVKIRWVVQARIARPLGPAIEAEQPFRLVARRAR